MIDYLGFTCQQNRPKAEAGEQNRIRKSKKLFPHSNGKTSWTNNWKHEPEISSYYVFAKDIYCFFCCHIMQDSIKLKQHSLNWFQHKKKHKVLNFPGSWTNKKKIEPEKCIFSCFCFCSRVKNSHTKCAFRHQDQEREKIPSFNGL